MHVNEIFFEYFLFITYVNTANKISYWLSICFSEEMFQGDIHCDAILIVLFTIFFPYPYFTCCQIRENNLFSKIIWRNLKKLQIDGSTMYVFLDSLYIFRISIIKDGNIFNVNLKFAHYFMRKDNFNIDITGNLIIFTHYFFNFQKNI